MAASKLTKREYETLAAFRFSLRQFLRFSEEAAKSEGTTPQQYLALLAIKGYPGREWATVGELAERLQVQHHSAVGLVDRLAGEGMVSREPLRMTGGRCSSASRREGRSCWASLRLSIASNSGALGRSCAGSSGC